MIQERMRSMQLENGLPTRQIVRRKEEIVGASEENENVPGEGGAFPGDAFGSRLDVTVRSESSLNTYPRSPAFGRYSHFLPRDPILSRSAMASRSPPAATPLLKSSATPESPKDATASQQPVPFPPPPTFEIIPPLHGILSRLLLEKGQSNQPGSAPVDATGGPGASGDAQSQSQQAPTSIPGGGNNDTGTSQSASEVLILNPKAHGALDIKDLPTETSSIRIRIQKARGVVEGLPDVHRSVEDQQKEIEELEDRVARLRSVISDFGSRAGVAA
jgi:hypothetical protein